jgi:hypothetical protein
MTDLPGQMTENVGQHDLAPRRRMQIRYRFTALVQFAALLLARHASRREEVPHGKQPVAVEESRHRPSGSRRRWPKCTPARLHAHNAVKYTPADGRITVTARAEGKDLVVSVKDNGLGISRALLLHVFDLFAQSSRTIGASAGGLGVGLAVVKAIAEAYGGTVTATSAGPGTGSEFTLRLPIVTKKRADSDRA